MRASKKLLLLGEQQPLVQLLFGHGENGFLISNFADLTKLFTTSVGPTNVAANDDPVGLVLDNHGWGGQTLAQVLAAATELREDYALAAVGAPTLATYDPNTGIGTASRTDVSNSSGVSIAATTGRSYVVDIEKTGGAGNLQLRTLTPSGAVLTPNTTISARASYVVNVTSPGVSIIAASGANGTSVEFIIHSVKELPGNHILQSQNVNNRPLLQANAGKPYPLFDGLNDALISPFYPMASGTGLTMAAAFNATNTNNAIIGGGNVTGEKRAMIGLASSGELAVHWGTAVNETVPVDRRNANHVLIATGDGSGRDVWLDGVNVTSLFGAVSGAPDGTGGALTLGGRQNTVGGGPDRSMAGGVSAAVALDRRVTPAEIARINSDFRATF